MMLDRSKQVYDEINLLTAGGVHSNYRRFFEHPIFFSKGQGSRLFDIDGNEYVDCIMNFGASILGHGYPAVTESVVRCLQSGLASGVETELSVRVVKRLLDVLKWAESVRLSNTGTEAAMKAIMMAREFSGRQRIIKIEGGYNGWSDCTLVSVHPEPDEAGDPEAPSTVPASGGLLKAAYESTIVMPFNNAEAAERIIKKRSKEIAAVLMEPVVFNMGCVLPKQGYLNAVREITEDNDVLLIFDEVLTGFRLAPGGAQERYGVTPDLAIYAKAIANGYPLSAIAGRRDILEVTRPGGRVSYAGTYNASQASLAASEATLEILRTGKVQDGLQRQTDDLIRQFSQIAQDCHVQATMQGIGGQFQIYFNPEEVIDYRTAARSDKGKYSRLQRSLLKKKVLLMPDFLFHHGISYSHTNRDLDDVLSRIESVMRPLADT